MWALHWDARSGIDSGTPARGCREGNQPAQALASELASERITALWWGVQLAPGSRIALAPPLRPTDDSRSTGPRVAMALAVAEVEEVFRRLSTNRPLGKRHPKEVAVHSTIISAPNLLVLAVVAVYAIDVQPMILLVLPLLILLCQFALEWPHHWFRRTRRRGATRDLRSRP